MRDDNMAFRGSRCIGESEGHCDCNSVLAISLIRQGLRFPSDADLARSILGSRHGVVYAQGRDGSVMCGSSGLGL